MLCAACGKRIIRRRKCLILALGKRLRLGIQPQGEEIICCSKACGCLVLVGEAFCGDLRHVPEGIFWPRGFTPRK